MICAEQVPRVTARRGELSVFDLSVAEQLFGSSAPASRPRVIGREQAPSYQLARRRVPAFAPFASEFYPIVEAAS